MTLVVFGIDALDPELVDSEEHPHLTLNAHKRIGTINSVSGEPSTHELWPTIITGLRPEDHGLTLDDGVAWEHPLLRFGSSLSDYLLPDDLQTRVGAWLLNNTSSDAFRAPSTYYRENQLTTVFDGREAKPIGIPNYVVNPDTEDREHQLRRDMGELFERDPGSTGGHTSAHPKTFYEQCIEMAMIRTARIRRGLRSRQYELVFGYTSGLDLIGHISHDRPALQKRAYEELNDFVGELRDDLADGDELILVSDHGLQDGLHTEEAMVASTDGTIIESVSNVTEIRDVIDDELQRNDHTSTTVLEKRVKDDEDTMIGGSDEVEEQLEDLGYL